jgi:hypothetical protein
VRRSTIGQAKFREEIDLVSIVQQLRVSRFVNSLILKPYQQQLVRHFKQYSLDQKTVHQADWEDFD